MSISYNNWLKKYGFHVSTERSQQLQNLLLASNYPQKIWELSNKQQYKQVKIIKTRGLAILTSMVGRSIKIFSLRRLEKNAKSSVEKLNLPVFVKYFKHQVIEVCTDPAEKYAFFSLTDFGKEGLNDRLFCLNLENFRKVFEIETEGKWAKFIAYHPGKLLVVSNWNSNDLSVIDIKNIYRPKLVQKIPCGISPRGIDFTNNGKVGIVACFYSRNIIFLKYIKSKRRFQIDEIMAPYDYPNYSGNMRHIVIDGEGKYAYVSNLGRSLIHKIDIKQKKIIESYPCGTFPNTISLSEDEKYLAVSCRQSNIACILDIKDGRIKTILDTGPAPTGLDFKQDSNKIYKLYLTSFEDDSVSCFKLALS